MRGSKRSAFTMLELIFAIVVISIGVISLPMMIQTTRKGIENNILQEAIFAASSELMGATAFYWDLNSMQDANLSNFSRVIDLDANCENNSSSVRNRLKVGHIAQPLHRRCLDSNSTTTADSSNATFQNLNNASHASQVIFTDSVKDAKGYKNSYHSTLTIANRDIDGTTNSSVKELTATMINPDNSEVLTVLRSYSSNIGEVDYYKRRF